MFTLLNKNTYKKIFNINKLVVCESLASILRQIVWVMDRLG